MGLFFHEPDLSFNTDTMRECAKTYGRIQEELTELAEHLQNALNELKDSGWTTGAGIAFSDMVEIDWKRNIDRYADMLDTLKEILEVSADDYEELVQQIEKVKVEL